MLKILFFFLVLFYCGEVFSEDLPYEIKTSLESGLITYSGSITSESLKDFEAAINSGKFSTLVVNSQGGDVVGAMGIAELVSKTQLTLIVDGECSSSCANYIFPAAKRKKVVKGSVVAIHGGPEAIKRRYNLHTELELNFFEYEQKEFYSQLDMTSALLNIYDSYRDRYLQRGKNLVKESGTKTSSCPSMSLWAPTEEDFVNWGVKGIEEFWYPKTSNDFLIVESKLHESIEGIFFGRAKELNQFCTD